MSARANSPRSELGLLTLAEAQKASGIKSAASFWRFRKRHKIPLLTGNQIHVDDLSAAFARERGIHNTTRH